MIQVTEELSQAAALFGERAVERLCKAKVAVFGLGGVGGYAAEALVRSGIGAMDIIDGDRVSLSDMNRHMTALHSTVGMLKTDVCAERFSDISPEIILRKFPLFLNENSAGAFDFTEYDYIIDAVGDVAAKVLLAEICSRLNIRIISSMGAQNKLDPMGFRVADIFSANVSPLARVVRHELRNRGIDRLKVVFSKELPIRDDGMAASCAYVCAAAGMLVASEVIKDLISENEQTQ